MEYSDGLCIGVGFRRNVKADEIIEAIFKALNEINATMDDVKAIATIEGKDEIIKVADKLKRPVIFVKKEELNKMDIRETKAVIIGVKNVAEGCALYCSKFKQLILPKRVYGGVTLYVVGIGPGSVEMLTVKARRALDESEYIVGYKTYVDMISPLIKNKKIITTGMGEEFDRVKIAVKLAKDHVVSLISGGDPSIYGILPFVIEYIMKENVKVDIEVVPGISALNAASALLGSPISGDHAVISLSDLLVPWDIIEKRLLYALRGDFVIAIYNPTSRKRKPNLRKALELILRERGDVYVGVVKNAFRDGQTVKIMKVSELLDNIDYVDMSTILIVSNSETIVNDGLMLTPRRYERKISRMGAVTSKAIEIARESSDVLKRLHPGDSLRDEIIRRCIATTGDLSIKDHLVFKGDIEEGVRALRDGCRIIVDVKMVQVGLRRSSIVAVDFADDEKEDAKVSAGFKRLSHLIEGSIVGIGNSPLAAITVYELARKYKPKLIVATPPGFINAAEAKEMIRKLDVPSITTLGSRGGSNICVAIINCLIEYADRSN